MKQLLRMNKLYNCLNLKVLLAFVIVQCLFLFGVSLNQASAAGGDLVRPATSDTPQSGKQEAIASVVDSVGNLIVTGYQNLAGGTDDDFWTVKFNADGTIAWRKTYNRAGGSDQATAIVLDSEDNVIVAGFAWNGNNYDIYTVKYSSDGERLWYHTYNAPALGNDFATGIAVDNLNNVYVCGHIQTASANEDYVVLKYTVDGPNAEGNPIWVATWNGAANGVDKPASIAAGVGGVAVTGQSWGSATNFDVMTVKLDYSGVQLWEKPYSSPGVYPDGGRKVAIDSSGNVIMTAAVTNNGNLDIYTAKYPAVGGDPLWEKTYNNPINNDEPFGLILDSSGNAYVTGYTFTLSGNEDLLVVSYSSADGTKGVDKVYDSGLSASDVGTDMILDSAGNLFVTGNTVSADGNHNIITLKIKNDGSNPAIYWAAPYDGPAGKNEETVGIGIGLGVDGEVIVGGWTDVWTNEASDEDYLMLVYDPGLLNPPSLLTATVLTDTDVKIDWTDNSTNEDGFRVERKLTELGEWSEVGTVGADITTFTDTAANGLSARNSYYYRVRSYNAANGSSNPSEEIRVLTLFVNYQAPSWSYIYNSPDNLDDYSAAGIATGSDNNPVVTGYSLLNANGFDYYTIKLNNSDGTLLWSDRYDDADGELDKATNVTVDSSNAVIVTGYSSLYFPPAASNINSIYTIKYPASCAPPTPCTPTPVWHGQYNGPGAIDDRAVAVAAAVDASDSVVVTGYGKNAAENEDIYLLKYAASPAVDEFGKAIPEWSATPYNSTFNGDDFPVGVVFDKDGNVFVAGHVQSSSEPVRYKSFVAKYCGKAGAPCNGKSPGEIIWEDGFAGSGDNHARSLAVDKDGNLYAAGFDTGANGRDILLIKYDGKAVPTGSRVIWSRTVDGAAHGDDAAVAVKYDQIDDTVVVGGTVLTASDDHDLIVIRFDSSGSQIESRSRIFLRPGSDEEATAMAMDVSGNVSIAGYTANGLTSDAISVEYDYAGTLLAATIYNGVANSYDEATAVIFNPLGDSLVAGYSTNAAGNADYLVYKRNGLALQASSPITATQYYTKVDLAWADSSSGETGFYVERKIGACDSGNTWALIYTAPANTTTYSDPGLNAGQEYCYRVRSFKAGEIDPRWVERYTLLDNPIPPGNPVATPVNTTKVDVTWQDNTTGETGFKIFRCSGAECTDFFELGSVGSNVVSYSDTTVATGLSYSYKILSYKTGDWESAYSSVVSVTTPAPLAPTSLSATRVSEGEINISWSDTNNDETGFKIERCEGTGCSAFIQIATVAANVLTFNDTFTLKANTTYRYQVRAYKSAVNSWNGPYSAGAEATTTLAATSGLVASPLNTTAINLSWTDNTGTETGFKIERCLGSSCSDFAEVGQTVASAVSWNDTGVCNGSSYTYRVSAVNAGLSMGGGGSWTRRKPLTISNFQPNFQTKVTLTYDPDMKANFDDIRFYDETNKREIPYYLESKTDGSTATVWIKTASANNIKLYYGNAAALSASNGPVVFEIFDDFDSLAAWTVSGSSVTASGGTARVDSGGSAALYRNFDIAYPYIAESRYLYPTANAFRNRLAITTSAGTGPPTVDYGLFDSGGHRVYWNGWTSTYLTINTWYTLQWEVTDTNYSFRTFNDAGTQLTTNSTGSKIDDLKRAYFSGSESATSDFNLDWFRIRKYAATVPAATLSTEEASAGYVFDNTWIGDATATVAATTPTPTAPTVPSATRISEIRIDLAWTDTTDDESGFSIERCTGESCSDFAEIGTVGAGITTFSDTTPMAVDTTYRYQIRASKTATCSGGWSGPASSIVSAAATLVAPSGLSATASVSTTCDDLRFTDSDGVTLLNYLVDSGCGTATTKVWLKIPTLSTGVRPLYLHWANLSASAGSSSPASIFDFYDDFSGTTIDTGKWVKADNGNYLSQNNEIIATGGSGSWGSNTMYSVANFARPFILELKHKQTGGNYLMFGVKDTTATTTYGAYHYAAYPVSGTDLQVYESGSSRGSKATVASNVWEYYKFEVLGTGARYYVGTSPATYSLFYDSTYSTTSPLKIGFDNDQQAFRMDDIRVRKYAATLPTFSVGAIESGAFSLTGGTWYVRRPITLTNSGSALTNYQQELTIDTTAVASDRINLAWTDNTASETGFIVERCTGTACDFSTIDTFSAAANATSYVDKSVALATTYCYRVKAEKSAVWTSATSNSACATTSTIAAPLLSVTTTTSNALSWTDTSTGEDGFAIERCEGATCDFSSIDSGFPITVSPNVTSYTDATVCAPAYRYRVKSFKYGSSGWDNIYSNIVDAITTLPSPPSALTATKISELQINLAWADNTTDETGFKVERCEGASCSSFSLIADLPANTVSYKDYSRVPNTTYRYRVRAYKTAGCGGWDTGYSAEAETVTSIAEPSGMTAVAPISTLVNLAWLDNTITETAFKLERCETASCTFAPLATLATNNTSYADASVCGGTGYTYRLNAVNEGSANGGGGTWTKRKHITFDNFQPNFIVNVAITYDPLMKPDFADLRFVDTSIGSELPYWIESKIDSSTANVWFKTATNSNSVYLYFGNSLATNAGSPTLLFGTGLKASYSFNEADGTISGTTADTSGTGNNLTLTNFASGYGVKAGGVYGNALSLNGTNNYAKLDAPTVPTGSVASIEAWIYPKAYTDPTYNGIVSWGGRSLKNALTLSIQNTGRLSTATWGNDYVPTSGPTATLNAWNHVAVVLNGTAATLYTNGQLVGTGTLALPNITSINLAVGALDYPGRYFNGMIDEVRIFNRALTAEEISGRYAATIPSVTLWDNETISAANTYNWTYASPYATATVTTPALAAPASLSAARNNESQITVSWSNVTGESVFELERCLGNLCDFSSKTTVEIPADTLSYVDKGLLPDTWYRYRIRSRVDAVCTAYSAYNTTPAQVQTTVTAPGSLTATALNTTQINLSWADNTTVDTGFKIERCQGSSCADFSQIAVTSASATSYTDSAVCSGTAYRYRIAALNSGLSNDGSGCWTRRKPVTISNFQTDFQTKVVVAYAIDMKPDFSDIRFYDPATYQELPYWIESKTDSTTATVWVKTRTSSTIYLYYGNPAATSSANGASTFQFFDDFSGTTINTARWTTVGSYYSQNDEIISTGGSGSWDSGMYSVTNFSTPFVFEIDQYRTAGGNMMIGAKNTGTGISYTDFTHAAYPVYDGNGNRLLVYEDGNWRGDNLKTISSDVWQYYKFEVLYPGAKFYHGSSPSTYTSYYTSSYSYANPLKVGFTNANMAFRLDNARVRKYASPEPAAVVGAEEQSGCYAFTGTYTSGYSAIATATTPAPVAPSALTATATTDTNINLTWAETSNDETTFRIERCSGASCSTFSEITTVGANRTAYSDTVVPSTDYCYRIRADKSAACATGWPTTYSNTACDKTFSPRTDSMVATAIGPFAIRLDWHDLATDEDGYIVQVQAWNGAWIKIATTAPDTTTYLDTIALEPLKTYTYRVRPYRGSDYSPFVLSNPVTTPPFTPGAGTCP